MLNLISAIKNITFKKKNVKIGNDVIQILNGVAKSNRVNAYELAKQIQLCKLSATDARCSVLAPHTCAACRKAAQLAEKHKAATYIDCY